MYLHARYYDPQLGIFLSPDRLHPKRRGVGTNRYSYAFGNPVNWTDRSGLAVKICMPSDVTGKNDDCDAIALTESVTVTASAGPQLLYLAAIDIIRDSLFSLRDLVIAREESRRIRDDLLDNAATAVDTGTTDGTDGTDTTASDGDDDAGSDIAGRLAAAQTEVSEFPILPWEQVLFTSDLFRNDTRTRDRERHCYISCMQIRKQGPLFSWWPSANSFLEISQIPENGFGDFFGDVGSNAYGSAGGFIPATTCGEFCATSPLNRDLQ